MPKGYPKDAYPERYGQQGQEEPVVDNDVLASEPEPEQESEIVEEPTLLSIEQVMAQIKDAQRNKDSAAALSEIASSLNRLTATDRDTLLSTPAISRLVEDYKTKVERESKPGTVVTDEKGRVIARVEPTWDSMVEEHGLVEWTPMQTRWITVNGVQVWVQQGVPIKTPPQFQAIAQEAWAIETNFVNISKGILRKNLGDQTMVMSGDGTPL